MPETLWVSLVLTMAGVLLVSFLALLPDLWRAWRASRRERRRALIERLAWDSTIHGSCAMKVTWNKNAAVTGTEYVPWQDWAYQHTSVQKMEED